MYRLFTSSLKTFLPAFIISALFFLSLSHRAEANIFGTEDLVIQETETGQIDWVKGVVRSKGAVNEDVPDNTNNVAVKKMKTLRQAKIDAMRNMIETIKLIKVDSSSTVGNYMEGSSFIRKRMHSIVKRARIVDKNPLSEGGMEVEIELPLKGLLTETMIQSSSDVEITKSGEELYTGLIVDAKGLDINPALSPKILNEHGREVFSASIVKRDTLLNKGLVSYSSKISFAETNSRIGDKPLIIRALRKSGINGTSVVISLADAAKVRNPSINLTWLTECRVIIVID